MAKSIEQKIEGIEQDIQKIFRLLEQMDETFKMALQYHAEEKILSAKEAADMLKMDIDLLYAKCRNGEIPHFKVGRSPKFKKSELLAWTKKQGNENVGSVDHLVNRYLQKNPLRR